jgi:uncharacterized protein (TIGR02466 family)
MTSPSLHYFFPTVLQASGIEGASELNRRLVDAVHQVQSEFPCAKPDTWSCDLYTTISHPSSPELLAREPFSELVPAILREATRFGRELGLKVERFPPRITDFWVNVFGTDHAQDVHRHPNSIISGIYYVQVPADAGDLVLHTPADDELVPPVERVSPLNSATHRWTPAAGQLLLFRSWLRHSVMPNRSAEERISVAFDICL